MMNRRAQRYLSSSRKYLLTSVICVSVLFGCGAQKIYDGPSRDSDEVATLVWRSGQAISVDGVAVGLGRSAVELLPGRHTLEAEVVPSGFYSPGEGPLRRTIEVDVEGGKRYLLRGSTNYQACVWVVEEQSGETVSVDPKGCGQRRDIRAEKTS